MQGALDLLILQTLQWGAQHSYRISRAIRINSGEALQIDAGSLYPARRRLECKTWIASEWTIWDSNQRIKAYRLTAAGKSASLRNARTGSG